MPISITPLVDQINTRFVCSLDTSTTAKLTEAVTSLVTSVNRVDTLNDLPLASDNTGTFYYVDSLCNYRYSNGQTWDNTYIPYRYAIWTWGNNSTGQLGDNSVVCRSSPVSVVGGFTDWITTEAACAHTLATRKNGTAWAWGINSTGNLGDGTTVSKSSPVSVVGGFTDWCYVSGYLSSAAIRTNGTLWTWGSNAQAHLGDNSTVNKSSPVSVVGGFNDWCQVSVSSVHVSAVRTNGTLWTWGSNAQGQLGDNSTVDRSSPVSVVGGFNDWCQVSAGSIHIAAIRTNGTLWTWGGNNVGQLGDNTETDRSSPVSVIGNITNWCQVSSGFRFSAAVTTDSEIWAWGENSCGKLGDNSTTNRSSPVKVVGGFTDWCQVSVAGQHAAAVRNNGSIWTWGSNAQAQLGDNSTVDRSSPVSVVGGFTDWCYVDAMCISTAGVRLNGRIWSWGNPDLGQLGDNQTATTRSSPVALCGGVEGWYCVTGAESHRSAIAITC